MNEIKYTHLAISFLVWIITFGIALQSDVPFGWALLSGYGMAHISVIIREVYIKVRYKRNW